MLDNLWDTYEEYRDAVFYKLSRMEEDKAISDEDYYAFEDEVQDVLRDLEYALNTDDIDYINSLLDELFELL
jgi:hypothetical protein